MDFLLTMVSNTRTTYRFGFTVDMPCKIPNIQSLFLNISMQTAEKDKKTFFLFGVLCGLALYNNSIIHLPFPLALFKKLLDVEPTLEDMKEYSSVGKSVFI